MVNKTTAQKAIVAALSGMMALAPIAPAFAAREDSKQSSDDKWDNWTRLSGDTRYDTMSDILKKVYGYTDENSDGRYHKMNTAILVSGETYPDALAASTLSGVRYSYKYSDYKRGEAHLDSDGKLPTPIIITEGKKLSDQAADALDDLNILNVIILGGENTISKDVENELIAKNIKVERIAGADRVETSLKAAKKAEKDATQIERIIIVSGDNFADAITAGPIVIGDNMLMSDGVAVNKYRKDADTVLLFTHNGVLSDDEVDYIVDCYGKYGLENSPYVFIFGGEASVSSQVAAQIASADGGAGIVVKRIAGDDRYGTAAAVASFFKFGPTFGSKENTRYNFLSAAIVATGETYPDALVGAPFAAAYNLPIVLVNEAENGVRFLKNALDSTNYPDAENYVISGTAWLSDTFVTDNLQKIYE